MRDPARTNAHLMRLTSGKMEPCASSALLSLPATASAAASIMSWFTCVAPLAMQPRPTPVDAHQPWTTVPVAMLLGNENLMSLYERH